MKKLLIIAAYAIIATVFAFSARGQTNAPVELNFFNQAADWGTSFNTNFNWTATLQFEDGYNQTTGQGASDYLRAQYNFSRWNVTAEGDFFGVGSALNAGEGGIGFAIIQKYDFKMELNALVGGQKIPGTTTLRLKVEPELKITKFMTRITYATASLSIPWEKGVTFDGTPAVRGGMGFTF